MEEIGEEILMKHMCKLCNKSFACGRSLGGHMRSHVINSIDHDEVKNKGCLDVVDKVCKVCGKGFQSWKALFGHMKCHSMKLSSNKNKMVASLDQDSWTSYSDNEDSYAKNGLIKKSRPRSLSRSRSGKRLKKRYLVDNCNQIISSNNASTSIVSEMELEQEAEVAMSLMMLSRDLGICSNSSVSFDCFGRSEVGLMKSNEFGSDFSKFKDSNKKKFECVTCNKSFHSHKALCGHKASHQKVLKRDFDSKIQSENKFEHKPVLDHDQTINGYDPRTSNDHLESSSLNLDADSLKKKAVLRAYECPVCFKVFTSGQALGGHKRSHLISEAKLNQENNNNVIMKLDEVVREDRRFLDLNMLPEEEEEEMNMSSNTTEYKSYCWEESSDHHSHESRILCLLSTI